VFWNSQEYAMYAQFNNPPPYETVSQLPRIPRH
jgi:hypothetical protein